MAHWSGCLRLVVAEGDKDPYVADLTQTQVSAIFGKPWVGIFVIDFSPHLRTKKFLAFARSVHAVRYHIHHKYPLVVGRALSCGCCFDDETGLVCDEITDVFKMLEAIRKDANEYPF